MSGVVKNVYRSSPFCDLKILIRSGVDFVKGFWLLGGVGPAVTVFGSARFPETDPAYKLGVETGAALVKAGFAVVTGGGPSIMEAANRGAFEAGGQSVGCNIHIPREQRPNPYVGRYAVLKYFFVRKFMLIRYASAFIILPGGLGTLDELFEVITLIQTGKLTERPVVLVGRDYWAGLFQWIEATLIARGAVTPLEFKNLHLVDTAAEAVAYVSANAVRR